jgi:hypothetical protein
MSNNNSSSSSGGIGFLGLLTIVFITLKLTGHITWSWWWVWSPMIFGVVLWLVIVGGLLGYMAWLETKKSKNRKF